MRGPLRECKSAVDVAVRDRYGSSCIWIDNEISLNPPVADRYGCFGRDYDISSLDRVPDVGFDFVTDLEVGKSNSYIALIQGI